MRSRTVRRVVPALGVVLGLVACTTMASPAPPSLVPLVPSDQLPLPTSATTTTAVASSDPDDPLLAALPEGDCAYADVLPDGEITFVAGDRLYGAAPDAGVVRCLTTVRTEQRGDVRWSPLGDHALLDGGAMFDGAGTRRTGFEDGSTRVVWQFPAGEGLVSPSASGRSVVRRATADLSQRAEVTVLDLTGVTASHPGDGTLVAAGSLDGVSGVFATPLERGADAVTLAVFPDPDIRVTELAVDAAGDTVYLVIDTGAQFRLDQLALATLTPTALDVAQAPITRLVVGPRWRTVAWRLGLCNSVTSVRVRDERTGQVVTAAIGTPIESQSLTPVGWLDSVRLVVEARPLGCSGVADVWVWNLVDGSATLLVRGVEYAATRTVNERSGPLAIDPLAQPPAV